jgi:hypothetical protein
MSLLVQNANGVANSEDIVAKFSNATDEIRQKESAENIVKQLRFREISDREKMVADAHKKTFEWMFDASSKHQSSRTNFVDWLTRQDQLYWITGKAGSGKSTMMKFLLNDSRTRQYLRHYAASVPLVVAEFFFWNSGTSMQMSQQGVLKTLLFQVAAERRDLIPILFPKRWHYHKRHINDLHSWDLLELQKAFKSLLEEDQKSIKLCFIDGLDEFSSDHVNLVSMI